MEAGICFLAAQLVLAIFHLEVFRPCPKAKRSRAFQAAPRGLVIAAVHRGGHRGSGARSFWHQGLGQHLFHTRRRRTPCRYRSRPASSLSISVIPDPTGSSVRSIPTLINEANANFFGLDTDARPGLQGRHRDRGNGGSGKPRDPSADARQGCGAFVSSCGSCACSRILFRAWICPIHFTANQDRKIRNCVHPALRPGPLQHEGLSRSPVAGGL